MTTLTVTLAIDIDGAAAADVIDDLAIDAEAGELDQAMTNVIRQHLHNHGDTRDWRTVAAHVWPKGEEPTQP